MALGPNSFLPVFVHPESYDWFLYFKIIFKTKRIFHETLKLYEIQISASINKFVLKYSHTCSFAYYL
jgi:hypothetical protein